jgi:MerR family transcriptional regulator, redox-sensitive transcriptional activator SoxR
MNPPPTLSIGELARRTGLSVSAIRYYEGRGLVRASRGAATKHPISKTIDLSGILPAPALEITFT